MFAYMDKLRTEKRFKKQWMVLRLTQLFMKKVYGQFNLAREEKVRELRRGYCVRSVSRSFFRHQMRRRPTCNERAQLTLRYGLTILAA
jgi:hypothetical protein